jgi:hypothetical protein
MMNRALDPYSFMVSYWLDPVNLVLPHHLKNVFYASIKIDVSF